jgi:MerR family transcriptional regulator, redox-sensitive transcriptional activator SoxR
MGGLTIGQVAKQAGVRPSAIRYYESIAVLPPPRRVGGQRRYDPAILERLAFIGVAQKLGFTLTEIHLLFHNPEEETPLSDRWRDLASRKLAEVDALIRQASGVKEMLTHGLRCGCADLLDCMGCVVANCHDAR